jgi:hypothetical protein
VKAHTPPLCRAMPALYYTRVPKGAMYKGTFRAPEDLLKFSLVFLRDLSWDLCSSVCSLMSYVMHLPTLSICSIFLFAWYQNLLKIAIYYSLTLILYKFGALLTVWNSTSVILKLYPFFRKTNLMIYNLFITPGTTQQITRLDHLQSRYMFRIYSHHQANSMITHIYTLQNCCTNKLDTILLKYLK